MKACVFDNTGDILPGFCGCYNSSLNMVATWTKLGDRAIGHWGHCKVHCFNRDLFG